MSNGQCPWLTRQQTPRQSIPHFSNFPLCPNIYLYVNVMGDHPSLLKDPIVLHSKGCWTWTIQCVNFQIFNGKAISIWSAGWLTSKPNKHEISGHVHWSVAYCMILWFHGLLSHIYFVAILVSRIPSHSQHKSI